MLFEVTEFESPSRELQLSGRRVTIGRGPASDIVLDDYRCSRHHAVVERARQGLVIRDAGSRNGIFVNGRLVRRSPLRVGDEVLIGKVMIRVLDDGDASLTSNGRRPEDALDQERLPDAGAAMMHPSSRERPGVKHGIQLSARPLTINLLIVAWWLIALAGVVSLAYAFSSGERWAAAALMIRIAAVPAGFILSAVGVVMGAALLARASWARSAHLLLCGAGLASCLLTLPSVVLILYFLRPQSERIFDKLAAQENGSRESTLPRGVEIMFSVGLLLSAALSIGLAYVAASQYGRSLHASGGLRLTRAESAAVDRLKRMAEAEESFRRICNTGYADLSALLHPATVIDDYPNKGPAFITPELVFKRSGKYQFELMTEESMPAAVGCPTRRYRRYRYSAAPIGSQGRHFLIGPESRVHVARDRPATFDDPLITRQPSSH